MISLKQLHYALAIEKTLHFKKASEICNVSQSALSTAINELEKQLGVTVFERNNKQVLVTQSGRKVLDKARKIKQDVDELMLVSSTDELAFTRPMTIGVIPTIGPYLLPKVLPQVRAQYPNFKLKIIEEQSHVLVNKVKTGDIDAAILALPFAIDGLLSFNFWQEDFYLVCHKDECPSDMTEITNKELDSERLMLLKDGHCLKDQALNTCRLPQKNHDSDFDSASLHTLIQMVAGKLGTTLVPQMALDQLIHNDSEINAIHLNEPSPHRTIALIIRPNYVRTDELIKLKDMFIASLKIQCKIE